MTSADRRESSDRGSIGLLQPSVTLSSGEPAQPVLLHRPSGSPDSPLWEGSMLHKQTLSDDLLPHLRGARTMQKRGGSVGSPATSAQSSHLSVGHSNTSSKSMEGLNSNPSRLISGEPPDFARTKQFRSMSHDDVKGGAMPSKQMPGEPTNYMEAAAAALKSGRGPSIIDSLMKEYRSGNLHFRQPAELLLPSAKENPAQQMTDLALHRENSAPQLGGLREKRMKSPPSYPGHSQRFTQNLDLTSPGTPRMSSPLSMLSDLDFPSSSGTLGASSPQVSSAFSDIDVGLSSSRSGRVSSPLFSTSMMSDFEKREPPPDYPGFKRTPWQSRSGREYRSSRESATTVDHSRASSFGSFQRSHKRLSSQTSYDSSKGSISSTSPLSTDAPHPSPASQATFELDHEAIASRATHMVEILSDENSALRQELQTYHQKVAKLQKFEQEIYKVQTEHERLVESTQKREHLMKLVRTKLEMEVKKLQERNRDLSVHMETFCRTSSKPMREDSSGDSDLHGELAKKDTVIFQLRMQCKDFEETNQQLMNELMEQRQHVDMLDTALSKAQADVNRLQEECGKRQVYVDKVGSLQGLVTSLQAAHQKREKLELKLRQKLEKEIQSLKGQEQSSANQDEGVSGLEDVSGQTLADQLSEREDTILKLEAEVSKWEHKYLEECAIRQCTVDIPPDSRPENLGDLEGHRDRDQQGDNKYANKARVQDLEGRMSALILELQKKDMIIQALHNQFMERSHAAATTPTISSASSAEKLVPPVTPVSPHESYQNLRRGSVDSSSTQSNLVRSPAVSSNSLQNLATRSPASSTQNLQAQAQHPSPASSTHSLHHYVPRSPGSSTQNLYMSPVSSNQNVSIVTRSSPATSQQNLSYAHLGGGRSPAGSQQSLGAMPRGLGSQERLMGFSDSYTSLSTSGLSITGTDGSDADLVRERTLLDEKLKQLDLEIAQQDRILGSIWRPDQQSIQDNQPSM